LVIGVVVWRGLAHAEIINADMLSGVSISAIGIDPHDTRVVYAGSDKGVFKSRDGGVSWTSPGLSSPTGATALVVDPQNSDIVWAAAYNDYNDGVFKSLNGGDSWTKVINLVGAWTIAVHPENTSHLSVGAGYGDVNATPGIVNSVDGGNSWHYTSNFSIYTLVIDPENSNIIYAAGNGAFLKSTDGGEHWQAPIPTWPFGYVVVLVVDPKNPRTLYAGTYRTGVLKSTDAGLSWTSVTSNYEPISAGHLAIDPNDTNILYATWNDLGQFGSIRLMKTVDGGDTWKRISKLDGVLISAVTVDPKTTGTIYLGTASGVWKSSDGGSTWSANAEFPILSLGANLCVGGIWYLRVSNARQESSIQLFGTSNGESWQIPNWRTIDSNRSSAESGIFTPETAGSHSLHVNVGGLDSNTVSFVVANCKR
jgi:photosystem II stability/assembly factor-like uncharacterized protein